MLAQGVASLALVYVLIGLSARLGCRFVCINVESPRAKHAINDNSHSLLCLTIKVHWGIACTEIFMTINGFGGLKC